MPLPPALRGESHLEFTEDPYTVERLMGCVETLSFSTLSMSILMASPNLSMRESRSSGESFGSLSWISKMGFSYLSIGDPALQRVNDFLVVLLLIIQKFCGVYTIIKKGEGILVTFDED